MDVNWCLVVVVYFLASIVMKILRVLDKILYPSQRFNNEVYARHHGYGLQPVDQAKPVMNLKSYLAA